MSDVFSHDNLPEGWEPRRLKTVAELRTSNVDKNKVEGERPVRLCNYTDVYYSDRIAETDGLMEATATEEEIRRFRLRRGDVLVTKDSETADDIAVPAYVARDFDDVLCGYHLAILRPRNALDGRYLYYALLTDRVGDQFANGANGITRFGLSQSVIKDAVVPFPPFPKQRAIADFLDRETAKIDTLIEKKQRLLELLDEKHTALITRAVTRGLDPDVPMKDSGVEWIGEIPEHWKVASCRSLFQFLDHRRIPLSSTERGQMKDRTYPYYGASGIIDHVEDYLFDEPLLLVAEDGANLLNRSTPLAFIATGKYWVNNHAHVLRSRVGPLRYWEAVLRTVDFVPWVKGAAQPKLTQGDLGQIPLPVPPRVEQERIATHVAQQERKLDVSGEKARKAVELLREYRTALISAAVTGRVAAVDRTGQA